ncbi:MAG: T9SS type A sorting domain-containing protein [Bacteroidetes bacterium]|nr:T9SS type A sorting domain-containing protein [Bacteroidota bacterium]
MLTDITGKIVALESGSAISRIDVSALSNGTYFPK